MYFTSPSCCQWKRGKNDALCDESEGKYFCATCWQSWIELKKRSWLEEVNSSETSPNCASPPCAADQENAEEVLEGMVHTDGNLYLVESRSKIVYASERSDNGDLVSVGALQNGKINLFNPEGCGIALPFEADPADHCETPFEAYEDLAPVLSKLACLMNKTKKDLKIWDPYFCAGSVRKHFASLGFLSVRNECEDFYQILESKELPEYDCIVTNPPYSSSTRSHGEELLKFLTTQDKPWFVVQPNFMYSKPFWEELNGKSLNTPRPFFLTPSTPRKYIYKTPEGARNVKSQNLRTSPFVSMWYCWTGKAYTSSLYYWITNSPKNCTNLSIACSEYFLPDAFKDSNDSTRRKKRKRGKKPKSGSVAQHSHGDSADALTKKRRR